MSNVKETLKGHLYLIILLYVFIILVYMHVTCFNDLGLYFFSYYIFVVHCTLTLTQFPCSAKEDPRDSRSPSSEQEQNPTPWDSVGSFSVGIILYAF